MKTEIAIGSTLKEVEKFDKTNMKNVDVQEKNPLPDKEGMLFLEFCGKNHFLSITTYVSLMSWTTVTK